MNLESKPNSPFQNEYFEALLNGNEAKSTRIIDRALDQNVDIRSVYIDILSKSQISIGDLWASGELGIAEEHLATHISLFQMQRLRELYVPRSALGLSVVVAAVEKEEHLLDPRMVADFLYFDGWDTHFLGDNMPADALIDFVVMQNPDLIALFVTMPENYKYISECVNKIRVLENRIPILVGGLLFQKEPQLFDGLEVDAIAFDAVDAVERSRELVGLTTDGPNLRTIVGPSGVGCSI